MSKQVYQVEGISCANCAKKFEKNVTQLPGVQEAQVNFGASKLSIIGEATVKEIESAGSFENISVQNTADRTEKNRPTESFIKRNWTLILSALLILCAFASMLLVGEGSILTNSLFITAIVIGGFNLFKEGLSDLFKLDFSMESLMTIAIIGAAIIGEWTEGSIVVILFAISEALEQFSMDKARHSIRSLMDIAPKEALIRRDHKEIFLSVQDIQIGDIMIIKPGQKIAMDGEVVKGHSTVNQASITGEAIPVEKQKNDTIFAGTLNEEGMLEVMVTKYSSDTTIAKIIHLVEEAQGERAPAQAFVDKFSTYYTPSIMAISALTILLPPLFFGGDWSTWIYQGLSILVVGCPCALVISTPVSIVSSIGNAAKNGVLIKGGVYLEELGGIQAIAFDKTGTLTNGTPVVKDFIVRDPKDEALYLSYIAALEKYSQHPLATSIIKEADNRNIDYTSIELQDFTSVTGQGVKGKINSITYYIGSATLFDFSPDLQDPLLHDYHALQDQGKTVMLFGKKDQILSVIAVADEVRSSSNNVISRLHDLGIQHSIMLTGDHFKTAQSIGKEIGVTDIKSDLMPEDKLTTIKSLQRQHGKVAMIGDGVNDAPALAASNVGIAMGSAGTDTALETADIALMGDNLMKLPYVIELSRKTLRIIKQNISFSLGIKLFALLLVIPGWLTLWIAILADMGATLLVTLNGLRLARMNDEQNQKS